MPSQVEDDIIKTAIAYLNENAGEHRRARWHVDIGREPGQTKASSYSGRLRSEDQEAIDAKRPFIGHHLIGGKLKPIVEATNESAPIATVDFVFEREGSGWKHTGFVHTTAGRAALDADRAELDARLKELLVGVACDGWNFVRLGYAWNEPAQFVRLVNDTPEPLSSDAMNELVASYVSFFAKRGLELQSLTGIVKPKPAGFFDLQLWYGVPHAS